MHKQSDIVLHAVYRLTVWSSFAFPALAPMLWWVHFTFNLKKKKLHATLITVLCYIHLNLHLYIHLRTCQSVLMQEKKKTQTKLTITWTSLWILYHRPLESWKAKTNRVGFDGLLWGDHIKLDCWPPEFESYLRPTFLVNKKTR